MKIVESLINDINNLFSKYDIDEKIDFKISNIENFDYQVNNLVKYQNHKKIEEIVNKISSLLDENTIINNFEVTKKYFINLRIDLTNVNKFLSNIEENLLSPQPKRILIDYGGPNIGKPLHVGHLRSLNIGRSLKELNQIIGNDVVTDIHLGDWGMPVAQIIAYCELENIDIKTLTAEKLIDIYPKSSSLYSSTNSI